MKFYLNLFLFFSQDIFSSSFTSCLPFSGVIFFFPFFPFSFSSAAVTEKVCVEASELACACRGKVCRCVCFWRLVRERLCFVLPISVSVLLQLTEWLWEREGGSVCLWVCVWEREIEGEREISSYTSTSPPLGKHPSPSLSCFSFLLFFIAFTSGLLFHLITLKGSWWSKTFPVLLFHLPPFSTHSTGADPPAWFWVFNLLFCCPPSSYPPLSVCRCKSPES